MLTEQQAIEIRDHVLQGIDCLMKAASTIDPEPSDSANEELRKAIGIAVGDIDLEILCRIYKVYPEIDHLKIKGIL